MSVHRKLFRRRLVLLLMTALIAAGCSSAVLSLNASATEADSTTSKTKKKKGWYKVAKKSGKVYYYYIGSTGKRVKGWMKLGSKVYYLTPKKDTGSPGPVPLTESGIISTVKACVRPDGRPSARTVITSQRSPGMPSRD